MSNLDQYLEQLGKEFGFGRDELEANKKGMLAPSQHERRRSSGLGGAITGIVFAVLFFLGGLGGAFALWSDFTHRGTRELERVDRNGIVMLAGAGVFLSFLCALGARSAFKSLAKRRAEFDAGAVKKLEGPAHKIHVRRGRGNDSFYLELGGQRFSTTRAGWELITQGARYRLYVLSGEILSLEPG